MRKMLYITFFVLYFVFVQYLVKLSLNRLNIVSDR